METGSENHRDHAAALEAELATARAERATALAELAVAKAKEADDQAIILRQKVYIESCNGSYAVRSRNGRRG